MVMTSDEKMLRRAQRKAAKLKKIYSGCKPRPMAQAISHDSNPFRCLLQLAIHVRDVEFTRQASGSTSRRRKVSLQILAKECFSKACNTPYPLREVKKRITAVVECCRNIRRWERYVKFEKQGQYLGQQAHLLTEALCEMEMLIFTFEPNRFFRRKHDHS